MRKYVVGFVVNHEDETVLVIKKTKPEWQAGRYNGIGGKIEPGEKPHEAMVREFEEETGVTTEEGEWIRIFQLNDPGSIVYVYTFIGTQDRINEIFATAKTTTEEQVEVATIYSLNRYHAIHNLPWILQFICCYFNIYEHRTEKPINPIEVNYHTS